MPEDLPMSVRRMVENEKLARHMNRKLKDRVTEIREDEGDDPGAPIQFFCECSFTGCRERFDLARSEWERIHADPDRFVVLDGHEVLGVERVVDRVGDYLVVIKHDDVVEDVPEPTDADADPGMDGNPKTPS